MIAADEVMMIRGSDVICFTSGNSLGKAYGYSLRFVTTRRGSLNPDSCTLLVARAAYRVITLLRQLLSRLFVYLCEIVTAIVLVPVLIV